MDPSWVKKIATLLRQISENSMLIEKTEERIRTGNYENFLRSGAPSEHVQQIARKFVDELRERVEIFTAILRDEEFLEKAYIDLESEDAVEIRMIAGRN